MRKKFICEDRSLSYYSKDLKPMVSLMGNYKWTSNTTAMKAIAEEAAGGGVICMMRHR